MQPKSLSENLKSDWKFLTIIIITAAILHVLLWIGWPLHAGADANTYIYYYVDFNNSQPVYHHLMCLRTPVAPFFFGSLLDLGGPILTATILEILSLLSIIAIYLITVNWSRLAGRIASIVFIFIIPLQIQFHQVGTDGIFTFLIIIFCLAFLLAIIKKKLLYWILLALIIVIATLTRPAGITLSLSLLVIPFIKFSWKKTLLYMLVFIISLSIPLGGYLIFKGIKYQDFSISRGFNNTTFYRIFMLQDNAIKPENGSNTQRLISYIEKYLLTTSLYKDYGVALEDFLTYKPNSRFIHDCVAIVDIKEGWDTNYKLLAKVSLEAIKSDPASFIKVYTKDLFNLNTLNLKISDISNLENILQEEKSGNGKFIEKNLEIPTEGEMIPHSAYFWLSTRPDGTLPSKAEETALKEKAGMLIDYYSDAEGNYQVRKLFNYLWEAIRIPVIYYWILGLAGIVISKKEKRLFILMIIIIFLVYIMGTLQGTPPWLRYRLPLEPILLIAGIIGFSEILKKISEGKPGFENMNYLA
jgi:hypothetical protein